MALNWLPKAPDDVLRYSWAPALRDGDSIASFILTVSSGDSVIQSSQVDGLSVIAFVSDGTAGTVSVIAASVVTADGEELTETIYLPIVASTAQATTARDVCAFALRKIVGIGVDADASELDDALELLGGLLGRFGLGPVPLTASSELSVPDALVPPLKWMLRKLAHSTYEAPLTAIDAQQAEEGERTLLAALVRMGDLPLSATLTRPANTVADLF